MKSVYHLGKSQKYAQKCEDEDSLKENALWVEKGYK